MNSRLLFNIIVVVICLGSATVAIGGDLTADNFIASSPGASTQAMVRFADQGSTKYAIGKSTSNNLFIWDQVNAKDLMRFDLNGNIVLQPVSGYVGVGATSPSAPLHILTNVGQAGALWIDAKSASMYASMVFADRGTPKYGFGKSSANNFYFWDYANSKDLIRFETNGDVALLPTAGKVGIGTNSPTATLDVNGDAKFSGEVRMTQPQGDIPMGQFGY